MATDSSNLGFRLWTLGHTTERYDPARLWRLVLSPAIICFSVSLGLIAGVFAGISPHRMFADYVLSPVIFVLCPVVVNFCSAGLIHLAAMIASRFSMRELTVPTVATVGVAIPSILVAKSETMHYLFGWSPYDGGALYVVWFAYMIASELIHYPVLRYIEPRLGEMATEAAATKGVPTRERIRRKNPATIGNLKIDPHDVLMLEAQRNYVRVVTQSDGEHTERARMSAAVSEFEPCMGFSPHRSYWVAFDAIAGFRQCDGKTQIVLADGNTAKVAGPRQHEVRDKLTSMGKGRIAT